MQICAVALVFDVNDFDETLPGPFEWDLKRLVASFAVGGRDLGFDADQRRGVNLAVTRSYREAMRALSSMRRSTCGIRGSTSMR